MVIAAGGTGGHVMPALAVADALRARGAEVAFVGPGRGGAAARIREAGYRHDAIPMRGLARRLTPGNLWAIALAAAATPRGRWRSPPGSRGDPWC